MEFLKAILGEELYNQFISKINEFNGDEANKDKQIKLANLTDGAYVSKDKYTSLETDLSGKTSELETANALKFALVAAGAVDVDYLVFKAKEKGEVKLGDDGKIKGEDDLISGLKTQHPAMFEASGSNQQQNGNRRILENNLPTGGKDKTVTKEQFLKMGYNERMKLKQENPELFKQLNTH